MTAVLLPPEQNVPRSNRGGCTKEKPLFDRFLLNPLPNLTRPIFCGVHKLCLWSIQWAAL